MRAIIVGGGVAGPALALFLKRIGVTATIYEAHGGRDGVAVAAQGDVRVGGGFQIAPNGMGILNELGLAHRVIAHSAVSDAFRFVTPSGKHLATFRNGRPEINSVPAVNTTREAVIRILFDAVEREGIEVRFGKRLVDISGITSRTPIAHFGDGTTAEAELIIGADGMRSKTRAVLFPDAKEPTYSGLLGFGGSVPIEELEGHPLLPTTLTFVVGSAGQFGYVRVSDGLCNWWSHVPREHEPTKAELRAMTTESIGKELSRRHAGWHEPVLTLIKKTKSITTTAVYALPTLRAWYRGRVALIGDAAHGTSPSAGQGASIALEDAMFLAKMLRTSPSPQEAYSRYERSRKARAEKVAMMARQRDAHEKKQLSPVQTWIRDKLFAAVLPFVGERGLRWQYEYRIGWDDVRSP